MDQALVAYAIPFFIAMIGLEVGLARLMGRDVYHFEDTLTDVGCGVTQQMVLLFQQGFLLGLYALVWHFAALWVWDAASIWTWVVALIGVDFIYYWWHRLSHRVNFLWAAHVVHHQSEDYNLAVALRQSLLTSTTSFPFYLPLAILGIPPLVLAAARGINTLYQFWIHTELVGRLGPLEAVMNTPSHHRVHHGVNPRYLDRNHAGMFIVWDRLFGTFEPESEPVVYGVVQRFEHFDAWRANLEPWRDLIRLSRSATTRRDKVFAYFAPPAWRPGGLEKQAPAVDRSTHVKFALPAPRPVRAYAALSFAVAGLGTFALLFLQPTLPPLALSLGAVAVFAAPIGWGALFHQRRWAIPFEVVRWVALVVAIASI